MGKMNQIGREPSKQGPPVDHDLVLALPYLSSSATQMFPCQAHTARA